MDWPANDKGGRCARPSARLGWVLHWVAHSLPHGGKLQSFDQDRAGQGKGRASLNARGREYVFAGLPSSIRAAVWRGPSHASCREEDP